MMTGASEGALEAVKWLLEKGCLLDSQALWQASRGGHVAMVEFLWDRCGPLATNDGRSIVLGAVRSGFVPILRWAYDRNLPFSANLCEMAAKRGQLDVLRFLRSHLCPWNRWTFVEAARCGHLDILQWALANGCPWTAWDRRECLHIFHQSRPGMRRWIEECWPEEPPPPLG